MISTRSRSRSLTPAVRRGGPTDALELPRGAVSSLWDDTDRGRRRVLGAAHGESARKPRIQGGRAPRPRRPAPRGSSDGATVPRAGSGLPDPGLTSGGDQTRRSRLDDLAATICRSGWSKSVRPPVAYTGTLKRTQIREYGYEDRDASHYQEDHLIPLSIGGAPRIRPNLGPEPLTATLPDGTEVGAGTKDRFELYLHAAVCDGSVALRTAQRQMTDDWIAGWEAAGRP